jgi:DNA-directed RNA polymerase subunit M/transcription elongation factor TFIIS
MDMSVVSEIVCKVDPTGARRITFALIFDILDKNARFHIGTEKRKRAIVEEIERGILNKSIRICNDMNIISTWTIGRFVDIYKSTRLTLCSVIEKINTFEHIEKMVMDKTVEWCDIVYIKLYEIRPDLYRDIELEIKQKDNMSVVVEYREDGWVCSKCKGTKYKVHVVQTRSSDEPASEYRVCGDCNHRTGG